MKLTFRLWGIHPDYPYESEYKYPWILRVPMSDDDEDDKDCISFLYREVTEDSIFINYRPRKL